MKRGGKSTPMNWLNELKIALISKDSAKAGVAVDNLPSQEELAKYSLEELEETKEILAQIITMLESQQNQVKSQILHIKAAKKFLESH